MPRTIYDPNSVRSQQLKSFLENNEVFYYSVGGTPTYVPFTVEAIRTVVERQQGIGEVTPYYIWGMLWDPEVVMDSVTILDPNNFIMFYQQFRNGDKVYYKADQYYSDELFMQISPVFEDAAYTTPHENCSARISVFNNGSSEHPNYFATNSFQIWNLTSHNGLGNHGYPTIDWEMYVIDATVPYDMIDSQYDPLNSRIFFFNKDNFNLVFGAHATNICEKYEGDATPLISPAGILNDFNYYYYTPQAIPKIRFTSPVNQRNYEVWLTDLTKFAGGYDVKIPYRQYQDVDVDPPTFNYYYQTLTGRPYIQSFQALSGTHSQTEMEDADFDDMVPIQNSYTTSLGELIQYFRRTEPTFSDQSLFTEIYMDFYKYNIAQMGPLLDTQVLDFSSLYESGIDPTVDDGSGDGEGHSWDPLPGHENDDTDDTLNPPDTNSVNLIHPSLTPYGLFNRTYILDGAAVKRLGDLLSTTNDTTFDAILEGLKMFGANPMNALIDLRLYPFDVYSQEGGNPVEIILGRYETGINGIPLQGNSTIIDLGSIYIKPKYESFLDYEPYTTIRLYIPYIGTIELAPSIYMGKTLSIRLVVDYITGAATAVIFANGIPMTYQSGVIGVSIAMTGDDGSSYANGIIGNLVGSIGSAAQAVGYAFTPGGAGKAVVEGASALGDLFEMGSAINDVKFQQAGSASPAVNNSLPQKPHIMIARPQLADQSRDGLGRYGNTVGYATAYSTTINSLIPGGIYYGVLAAHTGGSATEPTPTAKEIEMIRDRLNNGFFIGVEANT